MMSTRHGWGWQPPQTAFLIHIIHIQSAWAHWYAVHWHTAAALYSYTNSTSLGSDFGLLGHLVKVEADSHLKLLFSSILHIYKVFEHIDMLCIGIQQQPYTVLPTLLGSDFEVLGHLWSQHDVIMSWLRLTATSNWFPHLHYTYTKSLSTLICCALAYSNSLTQYYPSYLAHILRFFCVTCACGVNMMWLCHMVEAGSHLKLLSTFILYIYKVF